MKKHIDIIGIVIGFCIIILGLLSRRLWDWPRSTAIALSMAGGAVIGAMAALRGLGKMMKDKTISRELNDERNILIKYKSGYIVNCIALILIGASAILFVGLENYLSAAVLGGIFIITVILMLIVPSRVERTL